ncbi:MAG: bifunctional glutamate N-acetyltransferase/amino-acid acetyltransferase ArgJ [Phycisphaerales bacterium]|nr:bifunctional glutamate N-acetyltransferase/amino-acid acetyltransferase ArgJ [Phycisphaerales bacterium]
MPNHTITSVKGFRAAAMHCGIKASGKPDLAMLVSDVPAAAAAVFTQNKVVGAPIIVGRRHIHPKNGGILRACITNSGCANVCTGQRGIDDALEMCGLTADVLAKLIQQEIPIHQILPFSTGAIGHFLPMEKIRSGIPQIAANLSDSQQAGEAYANGILTTDLVTKTAHTTVTLNGAKITIAGNCKGSGMIAPNMATMLAYITTDAAISPKLLAKILPQIANETFNCVTIDQHTSTSDTFVVMANGLANGWKRPIILGPAFKKFTDALLDVSDSLAQQIAKDGEGATKLVTICVTGAKSKFDAKLAAEAIANSPLCKTAIHGGDPNWGRFVSAAGYSGAAMNPEKALCDINGIVVCKNGCPSGADLAKVEKEMKTKHVRVTVDLGLSKAAANSHRVYTCDLSREYIAINADYHT